MLKNKVITIFQVSLTYIGTLVGAGFASGQELLKFFAVFGLKGIVGAVLSGILFGIMGYLVVQISAEEKIESYNQLVRFLFGRRLTKFIDVFIAVVLYLGLAVMFSAGGTLFQQIWGVPVWKGFLITAVVIYLFMLMGTEGVLLLNIALVPGLIILSLAIAAYYITNADVATMKILSHINLVGTNWLLATILYVSYNFVLGAVILSSLGCTAEEGGKKGALLGGVIIGLMAAVMSLSLVLEGVPGTDRGIPMLVMAHKIHPIIYYAYFFALWSSILTTAIGNGYTILKRLQQIVYISRPLGCILVVVSTFPFLYWSFSTMVAVIYPMIGYLGFIFLLAIPLRLLQVKILQFKRR